MIGLCVGLGGLLMSPTVSVRVCVHEIACACMHMCECVRACVRACVYLCVCVCGGGGVVNA